jgi:hypothetical protein
MSTEIFGGNSQGSSAQYSNSGFSQLPPQIQQAFTQYATQANNQFATPQSAAYAPGPMTSGETTALNTINAGFTPTQNQINSSVNEQMNPYNQDVMNLVNQQAYGADSALNSELSAAGQYGSNRAVLGANNIANQQASTLGSILQPEFQTAMNNALTTIPQLNAQSAAAQLQGGQFQQGLNLQNMQAPVSALSAYGSLLGVLPQTGGSVSAGVSNQSQLSGLGGFGGNGTLGNF